MSYWAELLVFYTVNQFNAYLCLNYSIFFSLLLWLVVIRLWRVIHMFVAGWLMLCYNVIMIVVILYVMRFGALMLSVGWCEGRLIPAKQLSKVYLEGSWPNLELGYLDTSMSICLSTSYLYGWTEARMSGAFHHLYKHTHHSSVTLKIFRENCEMPWLLAKVLHYHW